MPFVCEPWFELPLVTEWKTTTDGRDPIIQATNIEQIRVNVRDTPSITGYSADVLSAMNQYDQYMAEREREAMEESKRR